MTYNNDDVPVTLEEAARIEQEQLWTDLDHATGTAIRSAWSMRCDNLAWRIQHFARFVGATKWENIPVTLLRSGVYQKVLDEAAIPFPPIGWDAVVKTEQSIAGRLGNRT